MKTTEFLEYLCAHPHTSALAESLAMVFVARGRLELIPVPVTPPRPGRAAS